MYQEIIFSLFNENIDCVLQLSQHDTVRALKEKAVQEFGIPESELILTGWKVEPIDDDELLTECANPEIINCLIVSQRKAEHFTTLKTTEDLELEVCKIFMTNCADYISENNVKTFTVDLVRNKIAEVCLGPLKNRKVLILYLHNSNDPFSTIFWRNLKQPEIINMINNSCCVIGWDLSKAEYSAALTETLSNNQLEQITPYIEANIGVAICIVTFKIGDTEVANVFKCLRKQTSDEDFLNCLKSAVSCQIKIDQIEEEEEEISQDFTAEIMQQHFAALLGTRDYDSYEFDELDYLKKNIAFAIVGPPTEETGYTNDVNELVEKLFTKILAKNNEVAQYKDKVEMAVIYVCTSPLSVEENNEKPSTSASSSQPIRISSHPIFVLRKCHESENPCRIFIDHTGRVYNTWKEYLTINNLPECKMIVPKDGRYDFDEDNKVILETHLSPACDLTSKVLRSTDTVSSYAGLTFGALGAAAVLGAPIVAPVAMIGGSVVGVYSMLRSSMALHDMSAREESMGFIENPGARAAYLNVVAGTLGFVSVGTNVVFSQLVAQGAQIQQGARIAFNTVNVFNLGASGISVANSINDVFQYYQTNNEIPSALTILQLTSSVLFFGHAVCSFRSATTIIDETQGKVLNEYSDSLRSNRHRKTFNRLLKETISKNDGNSAKGRAEIISTLKNVKNKDETFAALTRNVKRLNRKGIKVFAQDGQIKFNDVAIDMAEFCNKRGTDVNAFLTKLPVRSDVTPFEVSSIRNFFSSYKHHNISTKTGLMIFIAKLLCNYETSVQEKIIQALVEVLNLITVPLMEQLTEIFPGKSVHFETFKTVMDFFSQKVNEMEEQYQRWKKTSSDSDYNPIFEYVDIETVKRYAQFMKTVVELCFEFQHMKRHALEELTRHFFKWLERIYADHEENEERERRRNEHSMRQNFTTTRTNCNICHGYYFQTR